MSNVIPLFGAILHDEPAKEYLEQVANYPNMDKVIVIGQTEDGSLFMGSNTSVFETLVFLMFRANNHMNRIENEFEHEDEEVL